MTNIIFIHFGNSWYLDYAFKIVKYTNPNANIYLLGDDTNIDLAKQYKIKFKYFKDYDDEYSNYISREYKHIGTATIHNIPKHKFNILRWFRLYNFLAEQNINDAWYFDSDTLICFDLEKFRKEYTYSELYFINKISGCATRINSLNLLKFFKEYIHELYFNTTFRNYNEDQTKYWIKQKKGYNLCDMSFIREFNNLCYHQIGDLSYPLLGCMFDPNININMSDHLPNYPYIFEMEEGKKKIYWENNLPFFKTIKGEKIQAITLNLSWTKKEIFDYCLKNIIKE